MANMDFSVDVGAEGQFVHDEQDGRLLHVLYRGEFGGKFAPMSSEVDGVLPIALLESVVTRARRCLGDRSDIQVRYIAEFSDWIASAALLAGRVVGVYPDGTEKKITADDAQDAEGRELVQLAANAIQAAIDSADDGTMTIVFLDENGNTINEIDRLTRADVFAAQALVQYARATQFDAECWFAYSGAMHAMLATECVVLAEAAKTEDRSSRDEFKVKLGSMNSQAAQIRWRKLDPLKELADRLYHEQSWPSRAVAVRKIAPAVLAEAKRRNLSLSAMNAEATITSWLRKLLKR